MRLNQLGNKILSNRTFAFGRQCTKGSMSLLCTDSRWVLCSQLGGSCLAHMANNPMRLLYCKFRQGRRLEALPPKMLQRLACRRSLQDKCGL